MRTWCITGLAMVLVLGRCSGQDMPEPQRLQEALDGISYAELLNTAALTPEQLDRLSELQARLEAENVMGPDVAAALTKVLVGVLSGMPVGQAQGALGEQQQALQQAQQRWQQSLEQSTGELRSLLTDEQKAALIWFSSPAHALDGVVEAVSQARGAPDPQWAQFRAQVSQALSQGLAQAGADGGTTPEGIGELLDQARAMDGAVFEEKRGTLAQEWLPALMPNVAQMLQTEQFRQQQLAQVCQRLIAYRGGQAIVDAKRDAGGPP